MAHHVSSSRKRGRENIDPNVQPAQSSSRGNGPKGTSIDVLATPPRKVRVIGDVASSRIGIPGASSTTQSTPSNPTSTTTLSTPPKVTAPESPQEVKTPMPYHFTTEIGTLPRKVIRGLKGKVQNTVATDSAKKVFKKVVQPEYRDIRNAQRKLSFPGDEAVLTIKKAVVTVKSDEISVSADGKTHVFGVHETERKGQKLKRAYPIRGDGMKSYMGKELYDLLEAFKQSGSQGSFEEFAKAQAAKNSAAATSPNAQQMTTVNAPIDATTTVQQQTPISK